MSTLRGISLPRAAAHRSGRPTGRHLAHHLALLAVIGLGATMLVVATSASAAQGRVGLGTADSFAILAGAGITNTGSTTVTGDIGTFPSPAQTGFGSITLSGANHADDAVTQGAKDDLVTAYNDAAGRTPATSVPVELGGSTLLPGVYTSPSLGLTGTLTLDAQGVSDAVFIFQASSTLITEVNSRVLLINAASPCSVVWQVGSSATFKTSTRMVGDVLAMTSISAQNSATFQGRLLARNGAVTLDTNTITRGTCAPPVVDDTTTTTGATTSTTTGTTPTTMGPTPTTTGTTPTTTGTTPTTPTTIDTTAATLPAADADPVVVNPPTVDVPTTEDNPDAVVLNPGTPTAVLRPPEVIVDVPSTGTPTETATSTPAQTARANPGVPLRSTPATPQRGTPATPSTTRTSLPATGSSALKLLASGLTLVLLGATAVTAGRRHNARTR